MIRVELIKVHTRIKSLNGKHISFNCDSYQEYEDFYKFNFGEKGHMWSHNFDKREIKSIDQISLLDL